MKINFIILFQMAFVIFWLHLYTLNALVLGVNLYPHKKEKATNFNRQVRRKYVKLAPLYKKRA